MITKCWTPQSSHRDIFFSIYMYMYLVNYESGCCINVFCIYCTCNYMYQSTTLLYMYLHCICTIIILPHLHVHVYESGLFGT